MNEYVNKIAVFCINRIAELVGLFIISISIFLIISLATYSPEDPNFIFPESTVIENLMGSKGSFISDLLFQSFGLIAILIPFTFFFTGIKILISKKFLIIIENIFFTILYIIFGCLFFYAFGEKSYWLIINGNDGFVGNIFSDTFLLNFITETEKFSFYVLIFLTSVLFLKSINFRVSYIFVLLKKILQFFKRKDISESIVDNTSFDKPLEVQENETRIQENFSFEKPKQQEVKKFKFDLPTLDFLKKPSKKERESSSEIKVNEETLEKILLDFGVEGKIKKISNVIIECFESH